MPTRSVTSVITFIKAKRRAKRSDAWSLNLLESLAPFQAPVVADQIYDLTVFLVELVGDLEDGNHQTAFRGPSRMTAARGTPDKLAGTAGQALFWSILVDQSTFDHESLLEHHVLMVRQFGTRIHLQQHGEQAGLFVDHQRLHMAAWIADWLPRHIVGVDEARGERS